MQEGRFEIIKSRREKVLKDMPADEKKDTGLVRLKVFELSRELDDNLPEEEKKEIIDRMINRHIAEYEIGERGRNFCVDAIHSQVANTGEILNILHNRGDYTKEDNQRIIALEEKINAEIAKRCSQKRMDVVIGEMLNEEEYKGDKLARIILQIKRLHEDYTGELTTDVATQSSGSYFIARFVRRYLDANRPAESRKIKKQSRIEFGHGYQFAQYYLLQRMFKETIGQEKEGEAKKPFLHISLHGKTDKSGDVGDVILANGLKYGKMPCDPQIARWFAERFNAKMRERNIKDEESGEFFSAGVSKEGQRFCGNSVHCERRFGSNLLKPLGENYQFIQVELSPKLRTKHFSETKEILAEILEEFSAQFKEENQLREFLEKSKTKEDEYRLNGKMYCDVHFDKNIPSENILMSASQRMVLGVKVGEEVIVNGKIFIVHKMPKEKIKSRNIFIGDANMKNKGKVTIEKKK